MKHVLLTKYGPVEQDVMLDLAFLNAVKSKTDGEPYPTPIETEEYFGGGDIMIFGELELKALKATRKFDPSHN